MHDPFKPLTEEERQAKLKKLRENEKLASDVIKIANKCLHNTDFVKYRKKYETLEKATVESLLSYDEPNPDRYNSCVRVMLAKLHQLGLLLRSVDGDNRVKK